MPVWTDSGETALLVAYGQFFMVCSHVGQGWRALGVSFITTLILSGGPTLVTQLSAKDPTS